MIIAVHDVTAFGNTKFGTAKFGKILFYCIYLFISDSYLSDPDANGFPAYLSVFQYGNYVGVYYTVYHYTASARIVLYI